MTRTKNAPRPSEKRAPRRASAWRWAGFFAAPLAVALLVAIGIADESDTTDASGAIPFELSTTSGQTATLDDALARGDVLLYFSMGVGCDGCFAQIPELEQGVAQREITLVPIMVDPAPTVAAEASRFGIDMPILIDVGGNVSRAYGMIGVYGHADRPSHSFALVRRDGTIAWVRHYAEMFVSSEAFFSEMDAALGT